MGKSVRIQNAIRITHDIQEETEISDSDSLDQVTQQDIDPGKQDNADDYETFEWIDLRCKADKTASPINLPEEDDPPDVILNGKKENQASEAGRLEEEEEYWKSGSSESVDSFHSALEPSLEELLVSDSGTRYSNNLKSSVREVEEDVWMKQTQLEK